MHAKFMVKLEFMPELCSLEKHLIAQNFFWDAPYNAELPFTISIEKS